jgi:peptide/nickel transport system permease protein
MSVTGVILITFFALVALAAPLLAPPTNTRDPYQMPRDGYTPEPRPPGSVWQMRPPALPFWWQAVFHTDKWIHIFGTASGQWDIWYGIIWGARTAFRVGIIITFSSLLIGIVIGALAGYYGGVLDMVLMRFTEVFIAVPFFMAALIFTAVITPVIGKGELPATIALITFGWMQYARLIRGDILSVRTRDFTLAARAIGAKDQRILLRHILPNAIFPTLVYASMDIGSYVLSFAALSFLGMGADVGYADWGQMISFARNWISSLATYPHIVLFPGMAILLFVLAWNLIGDAFRDIIDPRLRGSR